MGCVSRIKRQKILWTCLKNCFFNSSTGSIRTTQLSNTGLQQKSNKSRHTEKNLVGVFSWDDHLWWSISICECRECIIVSKLPYTHKVCIQNFFSKEMNFLKCCHFTMRYKTSWKDFLKKLKEKFYTDQRVISSQRSIGNGLSSNNRKQEGYRLHRGNWVWTYLSPSLRRQLLTYYNGYKHRKWCVVCLRHRHYGLCYDYTLPKLLGEILHDTLKCSLSVNYARNTRMILVTVVN